MRYRATLYGYLILAAVNAQRWTSECGTSTARGRPTIVNGVQAEYGAFPWHVGVYKKNGTGYYDQICGGTLISPDMVISAAHCFYDDSFGNVWNAGYFMIAAGKFHRPYYWPEPHVQTSPIKGIEKAERYIGVGGNYGADIALIRLEKHLKITELVKPVCIDWDNRYESDQLKNGEVGKVVGWGATEAGNPSDDLREINLPFEPYEDCSAAVPEDFQGFISPTDKFCAGYLNGSSVCTGDSGGGLCFKSDRLWYLRGIVSTSPSPTDPDLPCNNNQYSAFTNVGPFLGWIRAAYDGMGIGIGGSTGCILPKPLKGASYEVSCQGYCVIDPGSTVPTSTILFHRCDDVSGYTLKGNRASVCTENGWNSLPICVMSEFDGSKNSSLCPLAMSSVGRIVCRYMDKPVTCGSSVVPGTTASLTCPPIYRISGSRNSSKGGVNCLEKGKWDGPTPQCIPDCGRAKSSYIHHDDGTFRLRPRFPWEILIGSYDLPGKAKSREISGTLIQPDLVLTSSVKGFFRDDDGYNRDISIFQVYAGVSQNLNIMHTSFEQQLPIGSINFASEDRGLVLLRTTKPFKMTTRVRPICIDWDNRLTAEHLRTGSVGKIPANSVKIEGSPERITEVDVAYVPHEDCMFLINERSRERYRKTGFFCAHTLAHSSFSLDTSKLSPFIGIYFESDGVWYLRGVKDTRIPDLTTEFLIPTNLLYLAFFDIKDSLQWIRNIG